MHSKNNNNKSQNFIQGLRPFSSSIPKTLKKHLKKGGYNYSNIVDNWTKMVGKEISDCCYPRAIKMGEKRINSTLSINVIHGKEIDIEYKKNEIIGKINSFFGYNCINQIQLKVIHEKNEHKEKRVKLNNLKGNFKDKLDLVSNLNLKESLSQLIKAYNDKKN